MATILSAAMMLRHSFQLEQEAASIERAVEQALAAGHRTPDLVKPDEQSISTTEMGKRIVEYLD